MIRLIAEKGASKVEYSLLLLVSLTVMSVIGESTDLMVETKGVFFIAGAFAGGGTDGLEFIIDPTIVNTGNEQETETKDEPIPTLPPISNPSQPSTGDVSNKD